MGRIDLDPASCESANKNVQAERFFSKDEYPDVDGSPGQLFVPWTGRIWLNHPFSREHNAEWIKKLVAEYRAGNIYEACCICFASTSEKWFRPLHDFPQCYPYGRTNYYDAQGNKVKGVTKGSVITYLGFDKARFSEIFNKIGAVKIPF